MINDKTKIKDIYNIACQFVQNVVQPGETFILKDLFTGVEWNRIPKGLRIKLGAMFYTYVCEEANDVLEYVDKTPQNQKIYRKKQIGIR